MRRSIAVVVVSLVFAALPASAAFATNPHDGTTGQPSQSCEEQPAGPPGFTNSSGFANAQSRYANVPESGQGQETNPNAVSQYDVACFQLSH